MSIVSEGGVAKSAIDTLVGTPDPQPYEVNEDHKSSIRITHKNPYVPLCESWKTDLQRAVDNSDPERLAEILETDLKSEIDKQGPDGECALHTSVTCSARGPLFGTKEPKRIACCELLLKHGANPNVRGAFGQTPLALASISHYPAVETTQMLVNAKADLLLLDDFGCTPMHMAAIGHHLLQLKILLTHPDAEEAKMIIDKEGNTPLMRAEDGLKKEYVTPAMHECISRLKGEEREDPMEIFEKARKKQAEEEAKGAKKKK